MSASGVIINGQRIVVPGAYSEVIASAAARPGVLAAGVPCLVGTAEDGEPQTVLEFGSLDELRDTFRSGDLREAADILYDAIRDDRILGRPTVCLAVKVNRDTQSQHTFNSASGPAMVIVSDGYGAFTERISVNILSGTNKGISLTIELDDVIETVDDLGGDDIFSVVYSGTAATMTLTIDSLGMFAEQTFTQAGLDNEVIAGFTGGDAPRVISNSTYDDFQVVTVYGIDASNNPVSESLTLDGTTEVKGNTAMSKITGMRIDALTGGQVLVTDQQGVPNTVVTHAADLAAIPTAGIMKVKSSNVADVGQLFNIRGISTIGTPIAETVVLNGTTLQPTNASFTKISAVVVTGTTVGTVTVEDSATTTIVSLGAGTDVQAGLYIEAGIRFPLDLSFDGIYNLVSDGASTKEVVIRGVNGSGVATAERVVLNGTTPVPTTESWKTVEQIEMGLVENAQTITFSGRAFTALIANGFDTLTILEDFVDAKPGFTMTLLEPGSLTLSDMDYATAIDITSTAGFHADLMTAINWINANSALVEASRYSGGSGQLSTLISPIFLPGGTDATATTTDYNDAFTLLESALCDYICPISDSDAVHAFADAHAEKMASALRGDERMIYVGVPTGTTKTSLKSKAAVFSTSRYMNMLYQEIRRRNATGAVQWYDPKFAAVLQMGAQASARRGQPLTLKRANILGTRSHSSIDSVRDAAELIDAGISNLVTHPTLNFVWQRTMTTYAAATINAYQESSASDALNASLKDLRRYLEERIVGLGDVEISLAAIKRLAEARLGEQISSLLISSARNVTLRSSGTAVWISYEVAPTLPRNFVVLRAHIFELEEAA
jgi:hypothetical protein